jgi:hypothetical protein
MSRGKERIVFLLVAAAAYTLIHWLWNTPKTNPELYRAIFQRDSALNVAAQYQAKYLQLQIDSTLVYQDLARAKDARAQEEKRLLELLERERINEPKQIKSVFSFSNSSLDSAFRKLYPRPDSTLRQ